MRFVSPLLKSVVYPALHRSGWLKRSALVREGCAVVNYHGILPDTYVSADRFLDGNLVSLDALRAQIQFLKANYELITPDEFRDWIRDRGPIPARAILITCDDGLVNNVLGMLPLFQSEGIRGLFLVTARSTTRQPGMLWYEELYKLLGDGQLGEKNLQLIFDDDARSSEKTSDNLQSFWWRAVLSMSRLRANERKDRIETLRNRSKNVAWSSCDARWRLMNADELLQLARAGMTIGAHTVTHPVLAKATAEESRWEIQTSKTELERTLGLPVWAFAYPFGNPETMKEREIDFAREAGFDCAFVNIGAGFSDRSRALTFPRTHVTADMSVAELEAHMTGFHARLQTAIRG
jgi:peptidoglycan/xylan/chitin deacetylase (PgdA/CDA1 family)